MKTKFFFFYLLPIIIWMGLIFYFSSQSVIYLEIALKEKGLSIQRWLLHIIEYAILSFLLYRGLMKSKFRNYSFILAILISVFYGLTDEVHQIFVVGRAFDFLDLFLDGIGSFFMQILIKIKNKIM